MGDAAARAGRALNDSARGMDSRSPTAGEALEYLDRVRASAPEIVAAADEIERQRRLPEPLLARLLEAGLFRMLLPRPFAGGEVEPLTFVRVIEEVAKLDASVAWVLCQTSVCAMCAAYLPTETAQEIFGRDPRAVLAWGAGFGGKAVPVDGGYRVTGNWSFASGGHHATWLGGHCLIAEADGTPRRGATGAPLTRTMLFPAAEVPLRDAWHVMGLKGTGSDAYGVTDVFVPEAHSFGRDGPADRRYHAPLYLLKTDTLYAAGFASLALGIARALVDALGALATLKTPRGYAHTLRNGALFQAEFAEMEARLRAARAYLMGTLSDLWDSVRQRGELTLDHRMAMRLAATHTLREAKVVGDAAYGSAGATAIFISNAFERRFRDMNAVAQQVQARRAHYETVGKFLLGLEADTSSL
jgi:indole-3-acetate monooxygenase